MKTILFNSARLYLNIDCQSSLMGENIEIGSVLDTCIDVRCDPSVAQKFGFDSFFGRTRQFVVLIKPACSYLILRLRPVLGRPSLSGALGKHHVHEAPRGYNFG